MLYRSVNEKIMNFYILFHVKRCFLSFSVFLVFRFSALSRESIIVLTDFLSFVIIWVIKIKQRDNTMKQTKRILSVFLSLVLLVGTLLSFSACGTSNTVYLAIEDYGIITVELYADEAPITVRNFKKLVKEGFYDGLTFHRVIESFMIQGGDPKGNGTGGADKDIEGEFKMNGHDTGIKHVEGTISMARSGHPYEAYHNAGYIDLPYEDREPYYNSASSQFFIVTETSTNNSLSLDGNYAAFGQVTDGMEDVKEISKVKTDDNDKPITPVKIAVATFKKSVAEAALNK